MQLFGEVTRIELDKELPALVVAFTTRINAEQAMLRGRTFKDRQLQVCDSGGTCVADVIQTNNSFSPTRYRSPGCPIRALCHLRLPRLLLQLVP